MQAVQCHSYGPVENLRLAEVPNLSPDDGQVLIETYSASLNFPDTLQIQGKYQFQPPLPFIPGSEVSGKIQALAPDVKLFAPGDRVMAIPRIGGMAEQVVCNASNVRKIPDNMDFNTAATFPMVYNTAYHALKQRANIRPGEFLLVLGASGGVGLAAVELGKLMGARVIAAASTAEKLDFVSSLNPHYLLNYQDGLLKEKVMALTADKGADVIFDPVGGALFDQCSRCINWRGRILVVGFASGLIPSYRTNLALLKGASLVGVFLGRFRQEEPTEYEKNFQELLNMFEDGQLHPRVTEIYPLEDYQRAFRSLTDRKAMGKIVLSIRSETTEPHAKP